MAKAGTRHNTLLTAAFAIGTLIPDHMSEGPAFTTFTEAAQIASASGDHPLSDDEIRRAIEQGLAAGQANPRTVPAGYSGREDAIVDLAIVGAAWSEVRHGGWMGRRCHQVLPAILVIALGVGGPIKVPLPITKLQLKSGASRETIRKALFDLETLGWITCRRYGSPGSSARYDIHLPVELRVEENSLQPQNPFTLSPELWQWPEEATIGHDAGRNRALGPAGVRIWRYLADNPGWHRQAAIARGLGISPGTVSRHTKSPAMLVEVGLVERNESRLLRSTRPITIETLDSVATTAGTIGTRDRERVRYAALYRDLGYLDEEYYWIDQRDGSRGNKATHLEPEYPRRD